MFILAGGRQRLSESDCIRGRYSLRAVLQAKTWKLDVWNGKTASRMGFGVSKIGASKQGKRLSKSNWILKSKWLNLKIGFCGLVTNFVHEQQHNSRNISQSQNRYLGRKRLVEQDEPFVTGATSLVSVGYSYWTLCYMITLDGAKKLMNADPLSKLIPVDEFLPIMFDRHPE